MSEKPDLDLEFDDIVGKTTTPQETTKEVKTEEKKQEVKAVTAKVESSFGLAYPIGNGQFKHIDLNTSSDEEFLAWVEYMFPKSARKPSDFSSREVRLRTFKNILKFHQHSLSWLRSQEKPVDSKEKKTN